MAAPNTKAGKLLGSISETTVKEWDQLLVQLSQNWTFAYANRQLRAKVEGDTTPPPEPPKVEGNANAIDTRASKTDGAALTIKSVVDTYHADERSPYHKLRFRTREMYDGLIKNLIEQCGDEKIAELTTDKVQEFYSEWSNGGANIAIGHSYFTIFRMLTNFGATVLNYPECQRLSGAIRGLKFEHYKPRMTQLTAEQAIAIRAKAHDMGLHSIALAQAFQFDCKLSQKDVIGEWVPISEPGSSDIIRDDEKWLRGIRWSEIDENLTLRHTTSRQQEEVEIDLRSAPMVVAELTALGTRPGVGPVIVDDRNQMPWTTTNPMPWTTTEFRRKWREIARAAGVPDDVFNRDTGGGTVVAARDENKRRQHRRTLK